MQILFVLSLLLVNAAGENITDYRHMEDLNSIHGECTFVNFKYPDMPELYFSGFSNQQNQILLSDTKRAWKTIRDIDAALRQEMKESGSHPYAESVFQPFFPQRQLADVRLKFAAMRMATNIYVFNVMMPSKNTVASACQTTGNPKTANVFINIQGCYFNMPEFERAAVIIHELTHHILGTKDHTYGDGGCKRLNSILNLDYRLGDPLDNADSYARLAFHFMVKAKDHKVPREKPKIPSTWQVDGPYEPPAHLVNNFEKLSSSSPNGLSYRQPPMGRTTSLPKPQKNAPQPMVRANSLPNHAARPNRPKSAGGRPV